jgi:multidrug efflux system membrane fusion protein
MQYFSSIRGFLKTFYRSLSFRQKLIGSIVIILILWGLKQFFHAAPSVQPPLIPKFRVEVQESVAKEISDRLALSGFTEANRRVTLRSEIMGKIQQVLLAKGSVVKQGEVIFLIAEENRPALLEEAKVRLEQKELEYDVAVKLQAKAFKAETALAAAKAELATARSYLALQEKNLAATKIKAPFDGIFEEKYVDVGAVVNVGDQLADIVDFNPLKVVCYVAEKDITELSEGMDATITLANILDNSIQGHITYISKTADPKTRTFQIEVKIVNNDMRIPSGATAQISINKGKIKGHFVPLSLISLRDDGVMGIKVVEDGKVAFKPVDLSTATTEGVWLKKLPEKILLITVGAEYVTEGEEVEAVFHGENKGHS